MSSACLRHSEALWSHAEEMETVLSAGLVEREWPQGSEIVPWWWAVSNVLQEELAIASAPACSPGHMSPPLDFSMLYALVLLLYLVLWVLVFEMVSCSLLRLASKLLYS